MLFMQERKVLNATYYSCHGNGSFSLFFPFNQTSFNPVSSMAVSMFEVGTYVSLYLIASGDIWLIAKCECNLLSFLTHVDGAKFEQQHFTFSRDILIFVIYHHLVEPLITSSLSLFAFNTKS